MKTIIISKRMGDYHVCLEGHPGIWACGKTKSEAIGSLFLNQTGDKALGIALHHNPEHCTDGVKR